MSYTELHCHSAFSLQDGASTPEALAARAAQLGMEALALTDHNSLAGAVVFQQACAAQGLRPIFGAELTLHDDSHLTLLVQDAAGWANLCALVALAQAAAPKGQARLPRGALEGHGAGLFALSGCRRGRVAAALEARRYGDALAAARRLQGLFPGRLAVELQHHRRPGDDRRAAALAELAAHLELPLALTNNVHYATPAARPIHDVLTCVRHHVRLAEAGALLSANTAAALSSGRALAARVPRWPEALSATRAIAAQCDHTLRFGLQDLPAFPTGGRSPAAQLAADCHAALAARRWVDPDAARRQLAHELAVIARLGLTNYLLIVADIVAWCRAAGIRCQGRGSAANALATYLLGISPIDPLAHDLEFGRFLSEERPGLPDIDLDIQADRREEVIQYVTRRYGPAHAAMACTVVTYHERLARRDLRRVLGGEPPPDLLAGLVGLPRHLGIHSGGMLLTAAPLTARLPTEPAAMPGRTVVQWDKQALEAAGMVKIDLLGLRMLGVLAECERGLRAAGDPGFQLDDLAFDDPAVYALIAAADTIGVFQVESRAQAQLLPRLRPSCFADLIVAISLIRPGPIQGDMVHPYLRRRAGREPVSYAHPMLEPALGETLGVILFQEQVLKVARAMAGFTPGQGEQLRRALGAKRPGPELERLRAAFLQGAAARGVPPAVADQVYGQLAAFAGYAFPKSHAAAFAVIVYQSAWLKRYHPARFYAALLNHQPMGFWSPAVIVGDARRHGVALRGVDVAQSEERSRLEPSGALRLGLGVVQGWGAAAVARLLAARAAGPFGGLRDLHRRAGLSKRHLEVLIQAGGLDRWGERRALLWELGALPEPPDALPWEDPPEAVELPAESRAERLAGELAAQGLAVADHPLALLRPALRRRGVRGSAELAGLPDGTRLRAGGLLVVRQQPPTAKGHLFLTLEDEDGLINVIVRPRLVERALAVIAQGPLLLVAGVLQQADGVSDLIAEGLALLVA